MSEQINLGAEKQASNENNPLEPKVQSRNRPDESVGDSNESAQSRAQATAQKHEIPAQFIDTEFEVPTDFIDLPSRGLFYPNGKNRVEVKYLTAEDETYSLNIIF